jgi:hypothetical protein
MERHLFCIEDPFELSHDLGRTVHADGCDKLRSEFRRAWDTIRSSHSVAALMDVLFAEAPQVEEAATPSAVLRTPEVQVRGRAGGGGRVTPRRERERGPA